MPRQARKKSITGIYHILLRGINGLPIFYDEEDYLFFIKSLERVFANDNEDKDSSYLLSDGMAAGDVLVEENDGCDLHSSIYAFSLLPTHVHMLVRVVDDEPGNMMKSLLSPYTFYINGKQGRMGHLFQDRFRSEPVECRDFFNFVYGFIDDYAVKMGLSNTPESYPYCSASNKQMISDSPIWEESMIETMTPPFRCIDIKDQQPVKRLSEEQTRQLITKLSGCTGLKEFMMLNIEKQKMYASRVKRQGGTIRTISRVTGLGIGIISRL